MQFYRQVVETGREHQRETLNGVVEVVVQVMVHQRDKTADIVAHVNLGKLSMIDLAGRNVRLPNFDCSSSIVCRALKNQN